MEAKLGIIADALNRASEKVKLRHAVTCGYLGELAGLCAENGVGPEEALGYLAKVSVDVSLTDTARFCLAYSKLVPGLAARTFESEEEESFSAVIPDIESVRDIAEKLRADGIISSYETGGGYSACAEDVEFGRYDCTLLPVYDPEQGRLTSFEKLRLNFGLRTVARINVDYDGVCVYDLCSLSYTKVNTASPRRLLSFEGRSAKSPCEIFAGLEAIGCTAVRAVSEADGDGFTFSADVQLDGDGSRADAAVMFLSIPEEVSFTGYASFINI